MNQQDPSSPSFPRLNNNKGSGPIFSARTEQGDGTSTILPEIKGLFDFKTKWATAECRQLATKLPAAEDQ